MLKVCDHRGLLVAVAWMLGGHLAAVAAEPGGRALPVVTLGRALPGAALSVARPAAMLPLGAEPGCLASAALSQTDRSSLWQALSAARREIRAVSGPAAEAEAAAGVRLLASNPGQRLTARFLDSAVSVSSSRAGCDWQARSASPVTPRRPPSMPETPALNIPAALPSSGTRTGRKAWSTASFSGSVPLARVRSFSCALPSKVFSPAPPRSGPARWI